MGLTPRQLDEMTLWEFKVAFKAWRDFNTVPPEEEGPPAMSDDRLAELGIVGFANGPGRQQ